MHALPTTRPPAPRADDGPTVLARLMGLDTPTLAPPPPANVDLRPELVPPRSSDRQTSAVLP